MAESDQRALVWRVAIIGGAAATIVGGLVLLGLQAALNGLAHMSTDHLLRYVVSPAAVLGFVVCLAGLARTLRWINRDLREEIDAMGEDIGDLRDQVSRLREKVTAAPIADPFPEPEGWETW
jgi:hypothetical protein